MEQSDLQVGERGARCGEEPGPGRGGQHGAGHGGEHGAGHAGEHGAGHAGEPGPSRADGRGPGRGGGLHVALIMDGSGRWAQSRGLPRSAGHRAGVAAVRRVVEAAPLLGIGTLTLYAFSAHNWRRPRPEVETLLGIVRAFLVQSARGYARTGVRIEAIGRRDRLPAPLRAAIQHAEGTTAHGTRLRLRLAIDYSAREAILDAARRLSDRGEIAPEAFARHLGPPHSGDVPDVDLLVRTGGEQRLSDFLLWECAHAELFFTPRMWPDFGTADLEAALRDFQARERRFGGIPEAGLRRAQAGRDPGPAPQARRPE